MPEDKAAKRSVPRLLLTPGDPAGIGPDITIRIAQESFPAEIIVVADPVMLAARSSQLKLPLTLTECNLDSTPTASVAGTLKYYPVHLDAKVIPGKKSSSHAAYVIETLSIASSLCQQNRAQGVITGPVNKEVINHAGIPFTGHTEFFAQLTGVLATVMLFVAEGSEGRKDFLVALATTHLPLKAVSDAITQTKLRTILAILIEGLQRQFHFAHPKIAVCGLNPHAGEGGYLGNEEIEIITPTLKSFSKSAATLIGPVSADTIFTPRQLERFDAVLAMYHDQALPVVKYASFGHAVNVTLGLPFVRTSVDHGTAYDLAGTVNCDATSLLAAIRLAIKMVN
ncbi:MAG: 4-hydroxythreonine-4-phosphate dehydrogenase PdxA [Gammaproteobacteria bacterium]|nr:4-hydroxythreonine-4-phosphate dehydrogenase PdxA [Gammaproteobacteria bacterium]